LGGSRIWGGKEGGGRQPDINISLPKGYRTRLGRKEEYIRNQKKGEGGEGKTIEKKKAFLKLKFL